MKFSKFLGIFAVRQSDFFILMTFQGLSFPKIRNSDENLKLINFLRLSIFDRNTWTDDYANQNNISLFGEVFICRLNSKKFENFLFEPEIAILTNFHENWPFLGKSRKSYTEWIRKDQRATVNHRKSLFWFPLKNGKVRLEIKFWHISEFTLDIGCIINGPARKIHEIHDFLERSILLNAKSTATNDWKDSHGVKLNYTNWGIGHPAQRDYLILIGIK